MNCKLRIDVVDDTVGQPTLRRQQPHCPADFFSFYCVCLCALAVGVDVVYRYEGVTKAAADDDCMYVSSVIETCTLQSVIVVDSSNATHTFPS